MRERTRRSVGDKKKKECGEERCSEIKTGASVCEGKHQGEGEKSIGETHEEAEEQTEAE